MRCTCQVGFDEEGEEEDGSCGTARVEEEVVNVQVLSEMERGGRRVEQEEERRLEVV